MSRKTLLTESEVRQFLKLANIGPVGAAKVQEMYSDAPGMRQDDEEEEEPGMRDHAMEEAGDEEMEMDAAPDMGDEAEMDMDDAEMDMDDAEMDMGDAPAAGKMVAVEDFMGALERALEDVLGDEVEVDMDDEAADEMGDDDAMDMDAGAMDMGDEEEDMDPMMEEEKVVNEVARRVAARLQAKGNKEKMVEDLAEKILQRITSK